jgi:DNA-3-methyladenine glycosylase I
MGETATADGLVVGPDGLTRCRWGSSSPDYVDYHDREWGRPVRGETALFERFSLEAFQSGLSWITILRKREGFRRAFAGFDPEVVVDFGPADVDRLLADTGIVRNRAKINAVITNARAVLDVRRTVDGGLDALVWSFAPEPGPGPRTLVEVPATTPRSTALAKGLKRHGFAFIGPTTAYAAMQACGLVNDHLVGCCARDASGPDGS